jgi:hypothetical protein
MNPIFNIIELRKNNQVFEGYNFFDKEKASHMCLNKINIFIGPNNSGKSRLLREIFKEFNIERTIKESYHLENPDTGEREEYQEKLTKYPIHNLDIYVFRIKKILQIVDKTYRGLMSSLPNPLSVKYIKILYIRLNNYFDSIMIDTKISYCHVENLIEKVESISKKLRGSEKVFFTPKKNGEVLQGVSKSENDTYNLLDTAKSEIKKLYENKVKEFQRIKIETTYIPVF